MRNGAETNIMNLIRNVIFRTIAVMLVTAAIAVSCVKIMEENRQQECGYIAFNARLSSELTKGSPVTSLSGKAGIIGYVYDSWPKSEEQIKNMSPWEMLDNEIFSFDGDRLAAPGKLIRWKEAEAEGSMLKVYAYAPAADDAMEVSYGTTGSFSLPSIYYTVPTDISKQTDIIAAVAEVNTDFNKNIPLTFDHILTAIQFKAGFDCKVEEIAVMGASSSGTYAMGSGWKDQSDPETYTISFGEGKTISAGKMITDEAAGNVIFMIPQTFTESSTASIRLTYDGGKTLTTQLKGITWEAGRMITYTLHKDTGNTSDYIYFDLAAGNISITGGGNYTGYVFAEDGSTKITVQNKHSDSNRYYVYQSASSNRTGGSRPEYPRVQYNEQMSWAEFITNGGKPLGESLEQGFVEKVIEAWDNKEGTIGAVRKAGREHTSNYIHVSGALKCNLTIDNIYTRYTPPGSNSRTTGSIGFEPSGNDSKLTLTLVGDSRLTCIHYKNGARGKAANKDNHNELIIDGLGSLTVADADYVKTSSGGYYTNHYNAAIGSADHPSATGDNSWGIVINNGVVFAGTTKAENSSAIGGGGNGTGMITINGGSVTAVATTTGTAIGGGIGYGEAGGEGYVNINGGNVYAYNFANGDNIPSAAIGGAGSRDSSGNTGAVNITGGNIYAQTALGTAIGGGSSKTKKGGNAEVNISGGSVIAKSLPVSETLKAGAGIGGGTGGSENSMNGGSATVTITGNSIIRTGSIGGGKTNSTSGRIGSATIDISGGDIQAQFVMAAGAEIKPSFTMTGGLIRNSDTEDDEYAHIQDNGGAVYLEDGTFKMSGGEIRRCSALKGGAIYIKGTASTEFEMTGGKITECASKMDGGAVYLEGGVVTLAGGEVSHNLANNGNGGGFCIVGGNFSMPAGGDAIVYENAAFSQSSTGGKGGGLYVTSTGSPVEVGIISGTITENSSDRLGGGIAVDMAGNDAAAATVTVGTAGGGEGNPSISSNHTIIMGGGLYANGAKANITINSGKIKGNTISGYVSNPDVANEGGMVTLNGGDVTHVVVTYNNNGSYLGQAVKKATQKIVTATNSTMAVPEEFTLLGYKLEGWNTRPDGKGTDYIEGQTMNLSANLTLYAQWSRN